jgi:hypothetical protein
LLERDGGGVGEGRSFHIFSSEMGEVSVRGGRLLFARSRWGRCRRGEELSYFLERDGVGVGEGRAFIIFSSEMGEVSARGGAFTFS